MNDKKNVRVITVVCAMVRDQVMADAHMLVISLDCKVK